MSGRRKGADTRNGKGSFEIMAKQTHCSTNNLCRTVWLLLLLLPLSMLLLPPLESRSIRFGQQKLRSCLPDLL